MSFVTLAAMNPAQSNHSMRHEVERLLHDVASVRTSPPFIPAANGYEDANGFKMEFDVPGFTSAELEVMAQDGALVVRGNKSNAEPAEGTRALFIERAAQSFERVLRLPKAADVTNITANHANGVLTVYVSKLATLAPRRVSINAAPADGEVGSGASK